MPSSYHHRGSDERFQLKPCENRRDIQWWIGALKNKLSDIRREKQTLPKKVPAKTVTNPEQIRHLENERKIFTDQIRMIAYRAETAMLPLVEPVFKRDGEEGRTFLQALYQLPADLIPLSEEKRLIVRFHTMADPRYNWVLANLCENLSEGENFYPSTDLRFLFVQPENFHK